MAVFVSFGVRAEHLDKGGVILQVLQGFSGSLVFPVALKVKVKIIVPRLLSGWPGLYLGQVDFFSRQFLKEAE